MPSSDGLFDQFHMVIPLSDGLLVQLVLPFQSVGRTEHYEPVCLSIAIFYEMVRNKTLSTHKQAL